MDSRTILAFALMILIYVFFFQQPTKSPNLPIATNSIAMQSESGVQEAPTKSISKTPNVNQQLMTKQLWIKNEKVEVEIDGLGSIKRVIFSKYKVHVGKPEPVEFYFSQNAFNQGTLEVSAETPRWNLISEDTKSIVLKARIGNLEAQRKVELLPDSYVVQVLDQIENKGTQSAKANLLLKIIYPPLGPQASVSFIERIFHPNIQIHESVSMIDGSVLREPFEKIAQPIEKKGLVSFTGFAEKYFFYGMVPQNVSANALKIENQSAIGLEQELRLSEKLLAPGEKSDYTYSLYLGPKELSELKMASPDLTEVVDYGSWIGSISRFLLSVLHLFHKIIPNYGIGIILLTILVKLVLFPLAYKSAVSMRRLQTIQPKMKEVREKYKDDKQRMNSEMMALYRTEKVNPVGGCLPMLIQMPVFFALYRVFFASIEFRQAPFFGWIKDLSVHDPYFVTPVLMTALMWYQTKVTPQPPAMDDSEAVRVQRAMMKWMPIIFGGIMIFLPAGLTLYFLVNALLSLLQQLYINKRIGPVATYGP